MDLLQLTLIGNAIFSLITGLGLIFFHKITSRWFGKQQSAPFRTLGIGLAGFALFVFYISGNLEPNQVWPILILDILWVLGSITVLIFKPFGLSAKGHRIIVAIALIVLLFAIAQFLGICCK